MASDKKEESTERRVWLSATSLSLMEDCPRCFWLDKKGIVSQPRGRFPSLPGGVDLVLKDYFKNYEGKVPPLIQGQIQGSVTLGIPETLRYTHDGVALMGKFDQYWKLPDGSVVPYDHKTRASAPKSEEIYPSYHLQLDVYSFLLEKNGYKTKPVAYITYYYPEKSDLAVGMKLGVLVREIPTDPGRVPALMDKAMKLLAGDIPEAGPNCEYHNWAKQKI